MEKDKYAAVWLSHTSMADFLHCPRSYYLRNIYRNPKTGHKVKIVTAPMTLGLIIHEILEGLSILPIEKRFSESLVGKLNTLWGKYNGKKGGFSSAEQETVYQKKAQQMLERVMANPGPLKKLAVKLKLQLPYYWLSEADNLILCGKIDWIEYNQQTDSLHIIDFKTSQREESPQSIQLPIYYLIASKAQKRRVTKMSYWYLNKDNAPKEIDLPDAEKIEAQILELGKKIKLARQLTVFKCPHKTGCSYCKPYEKIVTGEAEFVGVNSYNNDLFFIPEEVEKEEEDSLIL